MRNKKAFTLIELVSVLVILAILALIVTPLVLNIIKKARTAADKRSIDAYGRSIELAIADYLLDSGTFPTSIEELTIEYTGDKVVCSTTQLNSDSSVYLAECTVNNRAVTGYTYGKEEAIPVVYETYEVGDEITYNNVDYYVIKNSSASEPNVTLLKAEPLTVEEVNLYGANHINKYAVNVGTASNQNGYGGIGYYTSETCGLVGGSWVYDGCTTDYNYSDVRYVVDNWSDEKTNSNDVIEIRILSLNDLVENLGYEYYEETTSSGYHTTQLTPDWLIINNYYWTMSQFNDSPSLVWNISSNGQLSGAGVGNGSTNGLVRPVITIKKTVLENQ